MLENEGMGSVRREIFYSDHRFFCSTFSHSNFSFDLQRPQTPEWQFQYLHGQGHTAEMAEALGAIDPQWLDHVFKSAKGEFLKKLKNPTQYDFSENQLTGITGFAAATAKIDELEQSQKQARTVRGVVRIKPFVHALTEYAGVIEVFVQGKPEILSLIWVSTLESPNRTPLGIGIL